MKQRRLAWLLAVMLVLIALRAWSPPAARDEVVQAVERPTATSPAAGVGVATQGAQQKVGDDAYSREPDAGEIRNAFAARVIAPPPPPPAPPPPPKVAVALPPPPPPPPVDPSPPPPPLQVIGAWKDARGASVFIAGPAGVVQARAGDTVLNEYSITQITPQQVQIRHLPSSRDVALAVPPAAATTLR